MRAHVHMVHVYMIGSLSAPQANKFADGTNSNKFAGPPGHKRVTNPEHESSVPQFPVPSENKTIYRLLGEVLGCRSGGSKPWNAILNLFKNHHKITTDLYKFSEAKMPRESSPHRGQILYQRSACAMIHFIHDNLHLHMVLSVLVSNPLSANLCQLKVSSLSIQQSITNGSNIDVQNHKFIPCYLD